MSGSPNVVLTEHLPICTTCGTQFVAGPVTKCKICDDPRQYVPPSGQSFTTLAEIRSRGHKNTFTPYSSPPRGGDREGDGDGDIRNSEIISITTTPKLAIGQRAILIRTASGKNILWDCITLLDQDTIAQIKQLGGLHAIVISHPHYYSTHLEWAEAFDCPVYLSVEDKEWLCRRDTRRQVFLDNIETDMTIQGVDTGVKVIKLGGHFPGSLVLLYKNRLFVADTLMTTPSGIANWTVDAAGTPRDRPQGANSFAFMWSIPNYIPLGPDEITRMWEILKRFDFSSTHGAFVGHDIEDPEVKLRVLRSVQIQIRQMGWGSHPFLHEKGLVQD